MNKTGIQNAKGFIVVESADDFEQILALQKGKGLPRSGILDWRDDGAGAVFATRADARAAINRTEHYRLAYSEILPEKKFCRVVPVKFVPESAKTAKEE